MATATHRDDGTDGSGRSDGSSAAAFHFFDLHVVRTERVSPTIIRVTLGGEQLQGFTSGGRDQSVKLFLPHPGQDAPVVPTESGASWFADWRAMDPAARAIMRSFTVREQRRHPDELDIDFALHGDGGPASRWAARARPGDRVTVRGPVVDDNAGVGFRPPPETGWVLMAADETALPAAGGILAGLPAGVPARVWIEVPHADDRQHLPTQADAEITWLVRDSVTRRCTSLVLDAVRAAELPSGPPYAWVAGEAETVCELRRHLVREREFDRRAVTFTGYWRRGAPEEARIAEAVAGSTSHDNG